MGRQEKSGGVGVRRYRGRSFRLWDVPGREAVCILVCRLRGTTAGVRRDLSLLLSLIRRRARGELLVGNFRMGEEQTLRDTGPRMGSNDPRSAQTSSMSDLACLSPAHPE